MRYLFLTSLTFLILSVPCFTQAATEFVSKIAPDGDYYQLSTWESSVQTDLTATTTRVFSGTATGTLSQGDTVTINSSTVHDSQTATVVATTTAGQILVENATSSEPVVLDDGDTLEKDASNYWTVEGTDNELGDTAIAVAECYKGDYSTVGTGGMNYIDDHVNISGWTTDEDNYVKVYTPESERHDGKARDDSDNYTGFTMEARGKADGVIRIAGHSHTKINGIVINQNQYYIDGVYTLNQTGGSVIKNCIAFNGDKEPPYTSVGFNLNGHPSKDYLINSVTYDQYKGVLVRYTANIYNVTSVDNVTSGFDDAGGSGVGMDCYNCLAYNNGDDFTKTDDRVNLYNSASSDGTADDFGGAGNRVNQTFTFVDEANDDYHLSTSDEGARDHGVDLSSDPNFAFSTDIDGEIRPTNSWDIGADQSNRDFVSKIKPSSEADSDYTKLSTWEAAIESDLTASTSRVMTVSDRGSYDASVDDGDAITFSGGTNGILKHINSDDLLYAIASSTEIATGTVTVSGSGNTFEISDTGSQIGRAVAEAYKGDYSVDGGGVNYIEDHVTIDGWTTGENNYVKVYTPESERHNGVLKNDDNTYSGFTIIPDATWLSLVTMRQRYTKIEGLSLDGKYKTAIRGVHVRERGYIDSIILTGTNKYGAIYTNTPTTITNSLIYGNNISGLKGWGNTATVYNSTFANNSAGLYMDKSSSLIAKNVLAYSNTNGDFKENTSGSMSINHSASSDGTADDFGGTGNRANQTFLFHDESRDNYLLSLDDQGAKGHGTDLSEDEDHPFSVDIVGTPRPQGNAWDIGAFERKPYPEFRLEGNVQFEGNVRFE